MNKLLHLRNAAKAKMPDFMRQDIHKKKSLQRKWRKPKGLHSKLRLNIRGKGRYISPGYGSPSEVKGMHPSGVWPVVVHNPEQLLHIDAKTHGIVIASGVGNKKRVAILKEAQAKKIAILNVRNPADFVHSVESKLAEKKKLQDQAKKKEEKKPKKEEKKELLEKVSEEEKKQAHKQEKDKVLTKAER